VNKTVITVLKKSDDFKEDALNWFYDHYIKFNNDKRFICLTDSHKLKNIESIPLEKKYPGWLSKLEIFRKDLNLDGPIVYLDLDTLILSNIDFLFRKTHGFTMLFDMYFPEKESSGMLSWYGDYSYIYDNFNESMISEYQYLNPNRGDCGWITKQLNDNFDIYQNKNSEIVSYKKNVLINGAGRFSIGEGFIPKESKIVCFHGKPRPWHVKNGIENHIKKYASI
jgi:alpha-N-acetylglucosamine transferase